MDQEIRCVRCTYNSYIKMHQTKDGFMRAVCPRCGTEYIRTIQNKRKED